MKSIVEEYGYDLHFYSGDRKRFNYTKWFNRRGQPAKSYEDYHLSIGLAIDLEEDTFEFIYVTQVGYFKFSSSTMSNLKREDFYKIENRFVNYCNSLQNTLQ